MRELRVRSTGPVTYTGTKLRVVTDQYGNETPSLSVVTFVTLAEQEIIDMKWLPDTNPSITPLNPKEFNFVSNIKSSDEDMFEQTNYAKVYRASSKLTYEYTFNKAYVAQIMSFPTFPDPTPISDLSLKDGFEKLQPSFADANVDGLNIYTAILELADLKKTFTKSAWALKKSFDDIPEKNLLINFGVLPLFSDIKAMFSIVTNLASYIDKWNQAAANGTVWDKHVFLYGSYDPSYTFNEYAGSFTRSVQQWYKEGYAELTDSGKAHLYFKPLRIRDEDRKNVYINALGLAEPIEGIWEAVPFSWAIDYFLQIGDLIAAWDEALPTMFRYDFVSAGYSYKHEVKAHCYYTCYEEAWRDTRYKSIVLPLPFYRERIISTYKRVPVSYRGMIDHMERPIDYSAGWNRGWRQASYLASVTYLLSKGKRIPVNR